MRSTTVCYGAHMGKTVFISGAAQGIGRATATLFASHGWTVGAYDLSDKFDWAENTGILTGYLDVTDPQSWSDALNDFLTRAGKPLDALVNNAGILYGGPFAVDGSYEKDSALVDVNVKGVLYGARAAYPYLAENKGSTLVNVASAAAIYGTPDMAVYSATKFAVRGITEALELEWADQGITVRSVMPLYVRTGMLDGVETSGTKRMGVKLTAEDIASAIVDATVKPNKFVTKVHHPVGLRTKLMYLSSRFSPDWLARFANSKLTSDRKIHI